MTTNELHTQAQKLMTFLNFPEAIEKKGQLWCETHAMMLYFNLNSCTPEEADERLAAQVSEITTKLAAA